MGLCTAESWGVRSNRHRANDLAPLSGCVQLNRLFHFRPIPLGTDDLDSCVCDIPLWVPAHTEPLHGTRSSLFPPLLVAQRLRLARPQRPPVSRALGLPEPTVAAAGPIRCSDGPSTVCLRWQGPPNPPSRRLLSLLGKSPGSGRCGFPRLNARLGPLRALFVALVGTVFENHSLGTPGGDCGMEARMDTAGACWKPTHEPADPPNGPE